MQALYSNRENTLITGFEPHKYFTFKYVGFFSASSPLGNTSQQIMNLNSLFDPDRTGTGHQPYFYDQASSIYNRYRVLRTRYKVTFAPANNPILACVVPINGILAGSVTTLALFETAAENPRAVSSTVGIATPFIVQGDISLNDLNGCAVNEYLADDRFEALVTSSPAEAMTLYAVTYNPNAVTVLISITIELDFEADLHDPISVAGS